MRNPESDYEILLKNIKLEWLKACQHDGIDPREKFVVFSPDNPFVGPGSKHDKLTKYQMMLLKNQGWFDRGGTNRNPMLPQPPRMNPSARLYEQFHNAQPAHSRMVELPVPQGSLSLIGRAVQIEYEPEGNSKHKGTRFYHKFGDTGNSNMKSNTLVCTDEAGNIFLIKDDSSIKRPYFTERGIIG
jgi:hypothetical protein